MLSSFSSYEYGGQVPGEAVDLEGDALVPGAQGEIDEATAVVDVGDGKLRGQELGLLDAEDLGEQLGEQILRSATGRRPVGGFVGHGHPPIFPQYNRGDG